MAILAVDLDEKFAILPICDAKQHAAQWRPSDLATARKRAAEQNSVHHREYMVQLVVCEGLELHGGGEIEAHDVVPHVMRVKAAFLPEVSVLLTQRLDGGHDFGAYVMRMRRRDGRHVVEMMLSQCGVRVVKLFVESAWKFCSEVEKKRGPDQCCRVRMFQVVFSSKVRKQ